MFGGFIGALVTYGLQFVDKLSKWQSMLATIIAAVFTGGVIAFVDRFRHSPALGIYGVGLLIALMWCYSKVGIENIKSPLVPLQLLGWAHIIGTTLATLVAAALVIPPAFRDAWRHRPP